MSEIHEVLIEALSYLEDLEVQIDSEWGVGLSIEELYQSNSIGPVLLKIKSIINNGDKVKELEAENARLRQQRDSANALLDYVLEQVADGTE